MARPRKWKKVCCLPESKLFGSLDPINTNSKTIIMSVEEFETLRLIDLESFTQEECAMRMNVARATVQKLYNEARNKLANALVNSLTLKIEGGNYKLYDKKDLCQCRGCHRLRCGHNNPDYIRRQNIIQGLQNADEE